MSPTLNQMREAQTALDAPLFSGLPGDIEVSFEFFPPKNEAMGKTLKESVATLAPLGPRFVSVTYGAGGSTRERTHEQVVWINNEVGIPAAAHLTCVDATREEVNEVARHYWESGIRHIVALRGDAPDGAYKPHPGGYANAVELIAGLKEVADFEISVAAYPEVHPDSPDRQADLDNLKAKFDAGATRAITQFFFQPDCFFQFRDEALARGINAEIVPGIMPVMSFAAVQRMSGLCGTAIPDWMAGLFDGLDERPQARQLVSATISAEMCRRLYAGGVRNFHFYTLNRAELSYAICHMLGRRPVGESS
ncbi:methylenetetrahydrofolate reductase [NAD(P)H] [Erythrobacter sp. W53]|uniref:methylenetetrahydrofolate reductase [NAD(P)H] n=1 Tax=Erythrobacter sp. W53 TaxID=3425947 RepID=UPI003D76A0F4